ncbi:hypothetical protein G6F57_018514 [Rhizopus arrhizus]|nr:hypothetical protein G6F57_018514 [Rhizopus arrhizus]
MAGRRIGKRELALRGLDGGRHFAVADVRAVATVRAGQQRIDPHRWAFDVAYRDDRRAEEIRPQLADGDVQVPRQTQVHQDLAG